MNKANTCVISGALHFAERAYSDFGVGASLLK